MNNENRKMLKTSSQMDNTKYFNFIAVNVALFLSPAVSSDCSVVTPAGGGSGVAEQKTLRTEHKALA